MGRKLTGKKPKPGTIHQRRWRKRVARGQIEAEARREASRAALPIADGFDYRIGDCREVLNDIADNSVALVLTDPPYGNDAEPLYEWLGAFAKRVLIPGGSLMCFTGQATLLRDGRIFEEHLRYWWTLDMRHTQSQQFPGKFVLCGWKPILWFVKDHRRGRTLVPDVLLPTKRDKALHAWSQGDGGIWPLIEHLAAVGETVADPFAGTGTFGRIIWQMGRRWVGCDIAPGGTETVVAA